MVIFFSTGRTCESAEKRKYSLRVSDPIHDNIYDKIFRYSTNRNGSGTQLGYPLFNRIRESHRYYRDFFFPPTDIPALHRDVRDLLAEFSVDTETYNVLKNIEKVIRDAKNGGYGVYCSFE